MKLSHISPTEPEIPQIFFVNFCHFFSFNFHLRDFQFCGNKIYPFSYHFFNYHKGNNRIIRMRHRNQHTVGTYPLCEFSV